MQLNRKFCISPTICTKPLQQTINTWHQKTKSVLIELKEKMKSEPFLSDLRASRTGWHEIAGDHKTFPSCTRVTLRQFLPQFATTFLTTLHSLPDQEMSAIYLRWESTQVYFSRTGQIPGNGTVLFSSLQHSPVSIDVAVSQLCSDWRVAGGSAWRRVPICETF